MLETKELKKLRKTKNDLLKNWDSDDVLKQKLLCETNFLIDWHTNRIYENSNFDVYHLGKVLAYILSVYENKKFIFQEASTVEKKDDYSTEELLFIIVNKKKAVKYGDYTKHELSILVREGNAIILSKEDKNVFAYNKNKKTSLDFNFKFKKYKYLRPFIDGLILIKLESKKEEFTEKELMDYANFYIEYNYDKILAKLEIDCMETGAKTYQDTDKKNSQAKRILDRCCKKNKK